MHVNRDDTPAQHASARTQPMTEAPGDILDLAYAQWLDEQDPLAALRGQFLTGEPDLIYLDGNSLGRLSIPVRDRLDQVIRHEWGQGLVRSWHDWITWPTRAGDLIGAHLLGARRGEVIVCDSTSVNLYKLATAALGARPGRTAIVTDDDNFPSDRYVLQGVAQQHGAELRLVHTNIDEGPDLDDLQAAVGPDTALISLSHVAYRSGALTDMAAINQIAHRSGALVLWDLAHSAGAVPVQLEETAADLAVGCTYKYLNAGPGAPAFLYVRKELQPQLRQPIWGWFGQTDQFDMEPHYRPRQDITRYLTGTPDITGIAAVEESVRLLADAGIAALRTKSIALTSYLVQLADAWLAPLGFTLASPRNPIRRGSHVALRHDDAYRISQALIETARVVPDYRTPNRLRLGLPPATTTYTDIHHAMQRLTELVTDRRHLEMTVRRRAVT
jgi:kynureninase